MSKVMTLLIILVLLGIQFIQVERLNPPVTADIIVSADVKNILKTSCYDCHSNETKWPWYSKVAPISWMILDHVKDGRKGLNFSDWERIDNRRKKELQKKIIEEIDNEEMPLSKYIYLHPNAKLDITHKQIIKKWVNGKMSWGMNFY
jgi:hypothetical protein